MKGLFMKIIVVFCLGYAVRITERSFAICEAAGVSPDGVYAAAIAFFGTELAITMVKKILTKRKEDDSND